MSKIIRKEVELAASELVSYYSSSRYGDFLQSLHNEAEARGVRVLSVTHGTGIWRGELEPADSVEVEGSLEAVRSLAMKLSEDYEQEAVMLKPLIGLLLVGCMPS